MDYQLLTEEVQQSCTLENNYITCAIQALVIINRTDQLQRHMDVVLPLSYLLRTINQTHPIKINISVGGLMITMSTESPMKISIDFKIHWK